MINYVHETLKVRFFAIFLHITITHSSQNSSRSFKVKKLIPEAFHTQIKNEEIIMQLENKNK